MKEAESARRDSGRLQTIINDKQAKIQDLNIKNKDMSFTIRKISQDKDQVLKNLKEAAEALGLAE